MAALAATLLVVATAVAAIGPAPLTPDPAGAREGETVEAAVVDACTTLKALGSDVYISCELPDTASSVDLAELPGVAPGSDSTIWIQAWGGAGGSVSLADRHGVGGDPGIAQVVTTLTDYQDRFGTTTLHYALGAKGLVHGSWNAVAGGGGAGTIVASVDPATTTLDTASNVVAIAGGGGGAVASCDPHTCGGGLPIYGKEDGGNGAIAMSNENGRNAPSRNGGSRWGGGGGDSGVGGLHQVTLRGQNGNDGLAGIGGQGGDISGHTERATWTNDADLATALGTAGAGGNSPCMAYENNPVCISGGGGGGWGGGASGSNGNSGDYRRAGGGGAGSFAAPSTVTDPNAPTQPAPSSPSTSGDGVVVVTVRMDFAATFCHESTLAGTEGFRCVLPFNWQFEIPAEYTGDEWLVTLQALGGRGGNGEPGGRAQTTLTTTGLSGTTLYAWVGADGAESADHGGGGGGATALGTSPDPWDGASATALSPDLLVVAGGGGGGTALNSCTSKDGWSGGAGGVAVTASGAVNANANPGGGGNAAGGGAYYRNGEWNGGAGGSGAGTAGTGAPQYLTFEGGLGGDQSGGRAATVTSSIVPDTPTTNGSTTIQPAGNGGHGFCHGGAGGGGTAGGGGGAGGSGSDANDFTPGGGGGGGGSFAGASDVEASLLPPWADKWLTLSDQTSGQVSLFFYKASQGPPPVPADGATIDDTQPTLGLDATKSGSFSYRLTDQTAGGTHLASPSTENELWTVPLGGALVPGHTYSWEVVDGGNTVQSSRTFTVSETAQGGTKGVRVEMRSMLYGTDSNTPAYLVPEAGQKVPGITASFNVPSGCAGGAHPGCYEYSGTADAPDDYSQYFTTSTAAQAVTNPGAINMDFDTFDPFGLGLQALFTLHVTGTLTVPVTGSYTFGVNAFGGARFTLTDPQGNTVGGNPMVDSWGQVSNCSDKFQAEPSNTDQWESLAKSLAPLGCVNSHGTTVASQAVQLRAGVAYSLVMDGFMSWRPGPFQLLYKSDVLASTMAPVPGAWFTQPATTVESPEPGAACGGQAATIVGSDEADLLIGTAGDDVIWGGGGNDRVHGGGGADLICGGDGHDVLRGQGGGDTVWGGPGADRIVGGAGDDTLYGDAGGDVIGGGFGSDSLWGGNGADVLNGVTHQRWSHDPGGYVNVDRAHGGHGVDTCLLVRPLWATSCETDSL